jgi:hypothetical protein
MIKHQKRSCTDTSATIFKHAVELTEVLELGASADGAANQHAHAFELFDL